jgi:hypothetical protein
MDGLATEAENNGGSGSERTCLFARTTLEQLRIALAAPKRWVGWTIPQLIDRLAQVGVRVALESAAQENFSKY